VRQVAVLLYPGVELLDFAGPTEVFAAARAGDGRRFRVFTVAETTDPLSSQGCVTVTPQFSFADCPRPDLIVVPGGSVPLGRPAVVEWVRNSAREAEVALSVCNGALLFARAGLLEGIDATTHQGSIDLLAQSHPTTRVRPELRFVDAGRVVTTAGVSAGIDGALHVVARLLGEDTARRTALYMEYRWEPEGAAEYHRRVVAAGRSSSSWPDLEVVRVALADGVEPALAAWGRMADPPGEAQVNQAGYALLQGERAADALRVFELNAARFPASANVWDSLADACEALGRNEEAIAHARHALARLEQEPGADQEFTDLVRQSAQDKLARLAGEGEPSPGEWMCPPCPVDCHERTHPRPGRCEECGMALITKAEYERRVGGVSPEPAEAAPALETQEAPRAAAALLGELEAGRLRPATLLADARAAQLLSDGAVRRGVKDWLRAHPAEAEIAFTAADEPGERLLFRARVVDPEDGAPLAGVTVYLYHTDAKGIYADDASGGSNNPRLGGYVRTGSDGALAVRTVVPGSYPGTDIPRHVHYEIRAEGRETRIAEVCFADDPLLTDDARRRCEANGWPIATPRPAAGGGWECSVVLAAGLAVPGGR